MKLIALFNPLDTKACFGIPIFEENDCCYTQALGNCDLIAGFDACSVPKNRLTMLEAQRDASIGAAGVFCFFVSSSEIICGTKDEVREAIANRASEFLSRPFLAYEIADFLNDTKARDEPKVRSGSFQDRTGAFARRPPKAQRNITRHKADRAVFCASPQVKSCGK